MINTELNKTVEDALTNSYKDFYSQPYKDHYRKKEAKRKVAGNVVHRYNHGLAHAVRKAYYIPFIVDYFERHGNDHLVAQLNTLFEEQGKEQVIAKLQIVMAFEIAGRESECGSRDNLTIYNQYLQNSKDAFKNYCQEQDLVGQGKLFSTDAELESYAKTITDKYPNKFLGDDMDVLSAIVDSSHTLDEFRCYWPSRMKEGLRLLIYIVKTKIVKIYGALQYFVNKQ